MGPNIPDHEHTNVVPQGCAKTKKRLASSVGCESLESLLALPGTRGHPVQPRTSRVMISHQLRCIFIHIPKTGGTSIEQKLGHFQRYARRVQDHRTVREIEPESARALARLLRQPVAHLSRRAHLRRYIGQFVPGCLELTPEQYQAHYKFSMVRNPGRASFPGITTSSGIPCIAGTSASPRIARSRSSYSSP